MTKEHVADVLGVSIRTIENLVKAGKMPAPGHIGGRVLWHPDVFYTWLDEALRAAQPVAETRGLTESEPARPGRFSVESTPSPVAGRVTPPKGGAGQRMQARQAKKLRLDDLPAPG